jgi:hypothetical protein
MSLDERGLTRGELLYQHYKDNIIKVLQTKINKKKSKNGNTLPVAKVTKYNKYQRG